MNRPTRLFLFAVTVVAVLVACDAAAPAAPTPTPTTAPAAESPSPDGSVALPSFDLGSFDLPSFTAVEELEDLLPDELRGTTLQKFSFRGSDLFGDDPTSEDDAEFDALLRALGAQPDDYALAVAGGQVGETNIQIGVVRVAGADGARLLQELVRVGTATEPDTTVEQTTIAGKSVTRVTDPADSADLGPSLIYASGEVIFFVQSSDESLATEALGLLP